MTEPSYTSGWVPGEQFREIEAMWRVQSMFGAPIGHAAYRAVMRLSDFRVWCAPLGTPDPWPADEADQWVEVQPGSR